MQPNALVLQRIVSVESRVRLAQSFLLSLMRPCHVSPSSRRQLGHLDCRGIGYAVLFEAASNACAAPPLTNCSHRRKALEKGPSSRTCTRRVRPGKGDEESSHGNWHGGRDCSPANLKVTLWTWGTFQQTMHLYRLEQASMATARDCLSLIFRLFLASA